MNKFKRIAAIIGIVLILSMYVITIITAFISKGNAPAMFIASAFCTIAIPILIYIIIEVSKLVQRKKEASKADNEQE